jgi:toxin ParE1/3/4
VAVSRILRAPEAQQDLLDIWNYIARESSASIADTFLARLYGALEIVAYAPYIGRERPEFSGSPRSIVVRPYVIFYVPLPEGDGILLWRVIHGARNLRAIVRPPRRHS